MNFRVKVDSNGQKWTVNHLEFDGAPVKSECFINIPVPEINGPPVFKTIDTLVFIASRFGRLVQLGRTL